jgi:hypothetical protein
MSTVKSPSLVPNQSVFDIDMRDILRSKRANGSAGVSTESEERNVELAFLISQISFRSIQELDHLISGLQGVRQKLDDEGDRIQRQVGEYVSFSQSIVDLTKIVTEATTAINGLPTKTPELVEVASPRVSPAELDAR